MKSPHDFIVRCKSWFLLIPIRTFLVRFGGISGEFGRAMVRIFARSNRAKITHGEIREAGYVSQAYQEGMISYLPYPITAKGPRP